MGLVDFFTKKKANRNHRLDLSSSDEEGNGYDDEYPSYSHSATKRRARSKSSSSTWKKQQKKRRASVSHNKSRGKKKNKRRFDDDSYSSSVSYFDDVDGDEGSSTSSSLLLTKEELFDMPARELRKRCRKCQLDTSAIVEKAGLVELLHGYYKQQAQFKNRRMSSGGGVGRIEHGDGGLGNINARMGHQHEQSHLQQPQQHLMIDNEADQMVEILQEIIPYFGQGDPSIDSIVKDTIMKLPMYCLDNNRDRSGNTLLILCCQAGTVAMELIQLLLSKGGDPNCQNAYGETCLHYTCYNDSYSPENAKILVNNGAKAEMSEDRFGCTPLHYASSFGDTELCRTLLEGGAIPSTIDKNGCDSIAYATQSKKQQCIDLLVSVTAPNQWAHRRNSVGVGRTNINGGGRVGDEYKDSNDISDNDSDWDQLIDDQTGFTYFFNRVSGESMWEDEFHLRKKKMKKAESKPTEATSSEVKVSSTKNEKQGNDRRSRPPPPSPGGKDFRLWREDSIPTIPCTDHDGIAEAKEDVSSEEKDGKPEDIFESKMGIGDGKGSRVLPQKIADSKILSIDELNDIGDDLSSDLENKLSSESGSSVSSDSSIGIEVGPEKENTKTANSLTVEIPPKTIMLSPMSPTPIRPSKRLVSQDSFNLKLASMQEQWTQQLQKFENEVGAQKTRNSIPPKNNEAEESENVKKLQQDLSSKENDIKKLTEDIEVLESKLKVASTKPNVRDVMIGESDVRDSNWVASSLVQQLKSSLETKEQQMKHLQDQLLDLQTNLGSKERQLIAMDEKHKRSVDQVVVVEKLLKKEREAKNEAVILLEQTRQGISNDAEVSRSLEDEKRRGEVEIEKLRKEIQNLEIERIEQSNELAEETEKIHKQLLKEASRATSLTQELEERERLHIQEKSVLHEKQQREIESLRKSLTDDHVIERDEVTQKLQKETEARTKAECQRDEAVNAFQDALKRTQEAESNLAQMSALVKEAKVMVAANEKLHRTLHIEIDKRKALHNKLEDLKGRIRVYVRVRPLNSSEKSRSNVQALTKEDKRTCVMRRDDGSGRGVSTKSWEFDHIFSGLGTDGNSQEDVFKDTRLLITSAVDGFNVCIFAYGQTGSGKTYTMFGPSGEIPEIDNIGAIDGNIGLAPRAAIELFQVLEAREASFNVNITANMFEVYNDNIRDLLSPSKGRDSQSNLRIKLAEHSGSGLVEVQGAVSEEVKDAIQLLDLFRRGAKSRSTASTKMNADSSRSHLITSIVIKLTNKRTGRATHGKLTICDLAGSERVGKSGATGEQLKEAQSINKSLSSLGDVINALTTGSKHIPYRNHVLTMLMSDSMGGNAKTLMFVCCSPSDYNCSESTNSLDFAKRCKNVTNNVKGGGMPANTSDIGQVKALKAELARLKKQNGSSTKKKMGSTHMPRRPGLHK